MSFLNHHQMNKFALPNFMHSFSVFVELHEQQTHHKGFGIVITQVFKFQNGRF